jgi:serine/threonine-protein kinase
MKLEIGQEYAGGFIFKLDDSGIHGLVVAKADQSEGTTWKKARKLCAKYKADEYKDWYLPSKEELDLIYQNLFKKRIGGLDASTGTFYWSSTEGEDDDAWEQTFYDGYHSLNYKSNKNYVRAIRAF